MRSKTKKLLADKATTASLRRTTVTRSRNLSYAPAMGAEETELEMVRRHVREGGEHLANQRALIARLRTSHLPTDEAEALLDTFEDLHV